MILYLLDSFLHLKNGMILPVPERETVCKLQCIIQTPEVIAIMNKCLVQVMDGTKMLISSIQVILMIICNAW